MNMHNDLTGNIIRSLLVVICCLSTITMAQDDSSPSSAAVSEVKTSESTTVPISEPDSQLEPKSGPENESQASELPIVSTVGRTSKLNQFLLPGSQLEVARLEDSSPIVVRIIETFPHGPDMFRYDIEYYGLDPGEYNLCDYLKRVDGSEVGELPPLNITVKPVLPPGQVEPNILPQPSLPAVGGYRNLLLILAAVWVVGLFLILFVGRKKKQETVNGVRVVSLADRLRPMVSDAIAGKLDREQYADLEMSLVAFWRKKLGKENTTAANAINELKQHEEAGPLLRQLEKWLHQPGQSDQVNVAELLKPYENLPADALEPQPETVVA